MKSFVAAGVAAAAFVSASPGRADDDGVYGRLSGDVELRAGAGVALAAGGPSFAANAGLLYLGTAGVYGLYTDSLGSTEPVVSRSIAAGVHLQPLFLARYASDAERGPPRFDLFVDSFALEVGAFWMAQKGRVVGEKPGLELAATMAFPLFADSTGPFLEFRGAFRWRDDDLRARTRGDVADMGALFTATFAWHQMIQGHVVDVRDRKRP